MKYILIFVLIFIVFSCKKETDEMPVIDENLTGFWVRPVYKGDTMILSRYGVFDYDNYGISFRNGHQCTERNNSGFCGTPPIVYANFDGIWEQSDSIITIQVPFWGGTANYKWKVLNLSQQELKVKVLEIEHLYSE